MIDLGGFDELMAPFIFEETDLSYRALKRGWKIYYEPRCQAWHKHSSTIASVSSEHRRKIISYLNRMIFVWKNIQDPGYLTSHFLYIFFRLLIFPSRTMWIAFTSALKLLSQIRAKRKIEKLRQVLNDREIFKSFKLYYKKHKIL
jgi:GT2 family glycosyltransferase